MHSEIFFIHYTDDIWLRPSGPAVTGQPLVANRQPLAVHRQPPAANGQISINHRLLLTAVEQTLLVVRYWYVLVTGQMPLLVGPVPSRGGCIAAVFLYYGQS
jgi:hypothetical protein